MSFISIRLSTVKDGLTVPFKVYLKVANSYIKYLHEGDEFDLARLNTLRAKGVKKFFINEESELSYQQFLGSILESIHLNAEEVKVSIALDVSENSAQAVFENPASEKSYQMAKSSSDIIKKILNGNDHILKEIVTHGRSTNNSLADRIQGHLINTVSISIKFADSLNAGLNINAIGIAAFYHDVSFVQFASDNQKLFFKEVSEMSAPELTIYKSHCEKSVILLQDKEFADKEVIDLIMTHEEKISGQGFPNKLTKLTMAQEVLSLSAFYDREVTCLGKDADSVLNSLMIDQVGNYNLDLLKKFKSFLKSYL